MKSKLIFGLFAMTLILAFASASFAQINVQIFSSASPNEPINKRTAQTADPTSSGAGVTVSGSVIANAELTTTTITLTFGAPITAACGPALNASCPTSAQAAVPTLDPLRIVASTGLFAGVSILTVRYAAGAIDLVLPECKNNGAEASVDGSGNCKSSTPSGSFRVIGVRVDVNGKSAPMTVTASLNNNGNNYILTTSSGNTISALTSPLAPVAAATTTATVFTNGTIVGAGTASIKLTEGFTSAWRSAIGPTGTGSGGNATTTGTSTPNNDQILLTVAGLATGQSLTIATPTGLSTGLTVAPVGAGTFPLTFTSTTTTQQISITAADLTKTDSMTLTFTVGAVGATPAAATWTVTAQMGPVCASALDANGVATAANGYPCFANANSIGPLTLVNIIPAQTTLLIPYATVGGGYDTGIAIANTTADPFGTATGGAIAQSGTITLTLFPQLATGGAGPSSTLTTSATIQKPTGLTAADGTLAAGGSWTTLLSGLLPLATPPITGSFNGYIFVQTNFLDAHGVFYPTNAFSGGTFTAGSLMLVLPQPISTPRTGTELLNN